jgi:SAM-dependent methyltransferase
MTSAGPAPEFAGSVPGVYERLMVPIFFQPYAEDLARRVRALGPGSLLEIAAGTGAVTRTLAATTDAVITATDLNQAMIDRAIERGTSRAVEWRQADVMALPFEDASFDAVVCQFGVMFFDPQSAAFAEMHRVLRPGGHLLFNVWGPLDEADFDAIVNTVANPAGSSEARFFERVVHGYHDVDRIRADLAAGGFTNAPTIEHVELVSRADTAEDAATALCTGTPLRAMLERRGPTAVADALAATTAALTERFGATNLEARMTALVVDVSR